MEGAEGDLWVVVAVVAKEIVDLGGKVKFPRCRILHVGSQVSATELMKFLCPGSAVIGAVVVAPDKSAAVAGDYGTATAGHGGTARAGVDGVATVGHSGTATAGRGGTATASVLGTATAGNYGTATAGNYGIAAAGDYGTAAAGDYGTATAGDYGTAAAGDYGTATAGRGGTVKAGHRGVLCLHWMSPDGRGRLLVGYIGEGGLEAYASYMGDNGAFVRIAAPLAKES